MYKIIIQNTFEPYAPKQATKRYKTLQGARNYFNNIKHLDYIIELVNGLNGEILETN